MEFWVLRFASTRKIAQSGDSSYLSNNDGVRDATSWIGIQDSDSTSNPPAIYGSLMHRPFLMSIDINGASAMVLSLKSRRVHLEVVHYLTN